jgi:hypothetical protein
MKDEPSTIPTHTRWYKMMKDGEWVQLVYHHDAIGYDRNVTEPTTDNPILKKVWSRIFWVGVAARMEDDKIIPIQS